MMPEIQAGRGLISWRDTGLDNIYAGAWHERGCVRHACRTDTIRRR
jgi:hypothetical protein